MVAAMWRGLVLACLVSLGTWPAKAEAEPSGKGLSFRMLTFNTWGLPVPIGRQVPERFSRLSQSLAGFDWVTLQETFTRHAAQLRTSRIYPFQAWQSEGGFFKISSGLYTLSRFPIVAQEFREFRQSTDFDRFSRKGVLFTRLQVRPDLRVDVYNTHYQAQDVAEAERIRQHEDNRVLAEMVRAHDQGHPTFIQGDLNCLDHGPAYQDLRRRLPLRDLWRETRAGDPGWTMDRGRNPHTPDQERLDYLFFLDDPRWQAQVEHIDLALTAPVRGLYLSDHLGVQATITLRPRVLLASHDAPCRP
jgi:endonuclease/exonuclease/phosphatase family metal-dependent hydrolase